MMEAYRVINKHSAVIYYLLAASSAEAIERLTLVLGDVEGRRAWEATLDTPPYPLTRGVVLDREGKPVKSLEA